VNAITPNARQPRQVFDEDALDELKVSIREVGFLQPIVVREAGPGSYEIVMGERRWRAAQALGLGLIPAIVRDTRDDAMLRDALLENIHRANLNPLEEAAAYQQLLEEFGATHEELARRIGRSRPQISNTIRLLQLPSAVQNRVAAGVLSAGHARALLSLEKADQQEVLAGRIVAEGMSVRATEEAVALALAEGAAPKRPAVKRAKPHAPGLSELAERLSDHFETRVRVEIGRRKGRILVEFATVEDLERIVSMIGVPPAKKR
jgi:ParB family chromosome partitioning protein